MLAGTLKIVNKDFKYTDGEVQRGGGGGGAEGKQEVRGQMDSLKEREATGLLNGLLSQWGRG